MYKVKLLKDITIQKLEERINKFIENQGNLNEVNVNISVISSEDSVAEYIATIIYKEPNKLC